MDRGRAEKGLSDEKNFIRELTEKNLLLTAALEGVPEMIFLRDAAGRFLMCNRYATEFLGSAPESIVHKSFRELLGDCAAGLDELHERVMRSGQAAVKDDLKKERSTFSATCNPCFGADGSLIGSACFLRDVTHSLETSLELQSGRDRLEMAAQVSGIGIWDYDIAHDVLVCDNRWYEIMGRDPEHPVTDINSWKKWIHPDDAQQATEVNLSSLREMLARKENYAISFRIVRPNGEIRWVRSAACLIDGGTGTPRRVVGVVFDVTENRLEFTRLERLSLQDPLTELLNRRGFDQSLTSACEQALQDLMKQVSDTFTPEQRSSTDKLAADIETLNGDLERAQRAEEIRAAQTNATNATRPPRANPGASTEQANADAEVRAFREYVTTGRVSAENRQYLREERDVMGSSNTGVVIPSSFDPLLQSAIKDAGEIAQFVRVLRTSTGEPLKVADADPSSLFFSVLDEGDATTPVNVPTSGKTVNTDTLTFATTVQNQLLQDSNFSLESFLSETFGQVFAQSIAKFVTLGNSSNFDSLTTSAVNKVTSSGPVSFENLVDLYAGIDYSQLKDAKFIMSQSTWASLAKMKDGDGRYILAPNAAGCLTPACSVLTS